MANESPSVIFSRHPTYNEANFTKFRYVKTGGRPFIEQYLERHEKEDPTVFQHRKNLSYCPSFAREAVLEVGHAMYQRLHDVTREGGSKTYLDCVEGEGGGVDGEGSTMTNFMGRKVLEELLFMGRVGIFIDNIPIAGPTRADVTGHPYCYIYNAENILNWTTDPNKPEFLTALLLRDVYSELDKNGLPMQIVPRYRLYQKVEEGVRVTLFDEAGKEKLYFTDPSGIKVSNKLLNLIHIPFCMGDIGTSLLQDTADYQIAHMNLASSDIWYAWASNFPFFTEQYDPFQQQFLKTRPEKAADFEPPPGFEDILGTEEEIVAQTVEFSVSKKSVPRAPQNDATEITVGPSTGRRYPIGTERPAFIHPSSEPLRASIEKEEQLKFEIRQLVFLAVSNLQAKMASAESKAFDNQGLESGLAFVGLECETIERFIVRAWHEYEGQQNEQTKVVYPEQYSLKSDDERRKDAEEMRKLQTAVTSRKFQKRVQKDIVRILYGSRLSQKELAGFDKEIDASNAPTADPATIQIDHEAGLVSDATASEARGYEPGEAKKAAQDHAKRLIRIQQAQTPPNQNAAARGLPDQSGSPNGDAEDEKTNSQDHYQDKGGRGNAPKTMVPTDEEANE
jgi:hypothetical protein